jgi:hypothetical protein
VPVVDGADQPEGIDRSISPELKPPAAAV